MNRLRVILITLAAAALLAPPPALGQDCRPVDIFLTNQGNTQRFQTIYGPCTRVVGNLQLTGAGVMKLSGLNGLEEIGGNLVIDDTAVLPDLEGLETLQRIEGDFGIFHNQGLSNLDGLDSLVRVDGDVSVFANPELTDIGGLAALASVGGSMSVTDQELLEDLHGLHGLRTIGEHLVVVFNDALRDLGGLSSVLSVGGQLIVRDNPHLANLDGLYRLGQVGLGMDIRNNAVLTDLQGLAGLQSLAGPVRVRQNPALGNCATLYPFSNTPDEFVLEDNAPGCNSIAEVEAALQALAINPGFTDAWFNTATPGQGLLIVIFPVLGKVFLGWFTYDLERPQEGVAAFFGEAGHRWLTAQGAFKGREAALEITLTSGGVLNAPEAQVSNVIVGSMMLEFSSCNTGTVRFDLPGSGISGVFPIRRLAADNITLCESLQGGQMLPTLR